MFLLLPVGIWEGSCFYILSYFGGRKDRGPVGKRKEAFIYNYWIFIFFLIFCNRFASRYICEEDHLIYLEWSVTYLWCIWIYERHWWINPLNIRVLFFPVLWVVGFFWAIFFTNCNYFTTVTLERNEDVYSQYKESIFSFIPYNVIEVKRKVEKHSKELTGITWQSWSNRTKPDIYRHDIQ